MPFFYGDRIREALSFACGDLSCAPVDPKRFRLPAGGSCAALWMPDGQIRLRPCSLYGAPLVEAAVPDGPVLRFTFTKAFLTALLGRVLADLTHPSGDLSDPVLERYLRLAGEGDPALPDASASGVCLLHFCCIGSAGIPNAVLSERALTQGKTPDEKRLFYGSARPFYEGLSRLLYHHMTERNRTK